MRLNKSFGLFGILAVLVLTLSLASAGTLTPNPISLTANGSRSASTTTLLSFSINDTNSQSINITSISYSGISGAIVTLIRSPLTLNSFYSFTPTLSLPANLIPGKYTEAVVISSNNGTVNNTDVSMPINVVISDCTNGLKGNLSIDGSIDFSSTGDDDYEWKPLDAITITFDIKNDDNDKDIGSVYAKVIVLDSKGVDKTSDFNFDKEKVSLGTVKSDDTKTATFTIPSVPSDITEDDYYVYFKIYRGSDEQCTDNSETILSSEKITFSKLDERAVVLKDSDISTINLECGQRALDVSLDIYNVGSKREDNVLVLVTIPELKINQYQTLPTSLGVDKMQNLMFNLNLPVLNKTAYDMRVLIYYNYNKDDKGDIESINSYDSNSLDDLDKSFIFSLKMPNSCIVQIAKPTISASVSTQDVRVGSPMEVTVTFLNNGAAATYLMSLAGYDSWANSASIEPASATVAAGSSQTFTVKLTPTKEGVQNFTVRAITNGQIVEQPMQVTVGAKAGMLSGLRSAVADITGSEDNAVFYLIVGIFIILIVLILILIVKALSKPKRGKRRDDEDDDNEED
jgi:hypothetical protein